MHLEYRSVLCHIIAQRCNPPVRLAQHRIQQDALLDLILLDTRRLDAPELPLAPGTEVQKHLIHERLGVARVALPFDTLVGEADRAPEILELLNVSNTVAQNLPRAIELRTEALQQRRQLAASAEDKEIIHVRNHNHQGDGVHKDALSADQWLVPSLL